MMWPSMDDVATGAALGAIIFNGVGTSIVRLCSSQYGSNGTARCQTPNFNRAAYRHKRRAKGNSTHRSGAEIGAQSKAE